MGLSGEAQEAWVGGLNACQFGRMDLDGDGKKDLLVFDRHDQRLLCFLNRGETGAIDYRFTRAYESAFPVLHDWVEVADYDGDGREDLFFYSKGWAGIAVYRNVTSEGKLAFEPVAYPYLTSWQGGGEVNILASEADYPALIDMDRDGDLDILTFGVLGTFLEKHRNLSVERYGCRDSLVFERVDPCWGRVAESEEDNLMYLDTCLFGYGIVVPDEAMRHRGATVALRDLTGDGLLDLLLADVDYPGLTLLVNGGDASQAVMVSQQTDFPASHPVRLFSMPAPFFTDVDNDGVDDLLVSPFDPDPMACESWESVWLYLNRGTNECANFQLYTKTFLQDAMIDLGAGAFPTFADVDGDGLTDLLVGTIGDVDSTWYQYGSLQTHWSGRLAFFQNVGSNQAPAFRLADGDFAHLKAQGRMGWVPAFADLDGDGRLEMLVGTAEGRLWLFGHDGTLLDDDFLHYDQPWSAPCFADVDQDGTMDLVVGNATGKLSFYKGVSSMNDHFEWITDRWGGVDVCDHDASYYGYSVPTVFWQDDALLLCVGSESGKLFLFEGLAADAQTVFEEVPERWDRICPELPSHLGKRTSAAVADLNGDGQVEVVVGNFGGGLQLFNADIPLLNLGMVEHPDHPNIMIFPNPVVSELQVVSKEDMIETLVISDLYGRTLKIQPVGELEAMVEVGGLPTGVYLLTLVCERGAVNRIFLKR